MVSVSAHRFHSHGADSFSLLFLPSFLPLPFISLVQYIRGPAHLLVFLFVTDCCILLAFRKVTSLADITACNKNGYKSTLKCLDTKSSEITD